MPYLIDGHNLIPKLGLRLDSAEDEMELLRMLGEYCRYSRKQGLEVYFDGAPTPMAGSRQIGLIKAHFVHQGISADDAIRNRLKKLGKAAKNWSVVSSDRQVQADARAAHAAVISSDEFAEQVMNVLRAGPPSGSSQPTLGPAQLDEWMELFRNGKKPS